jgi:hypothetical protein
MVPRGAEGAPRVDIPSAAADAPSWTRVGVIAVIGFVVGVAWPRVAGVRLGPSLPEGTPSQAALSASASASGPAPSPVPNAVPAASPVPTVALAVAATGAAAEPPAVPSATPTPAGSIADEPSEPASSTVQVAWDVALIRAAPKTGKVLARLPRGTVVRLGPIQDGWYPVNYGRGYASEGWVFRGAIGR